MATHPHTASKKIALVTGAAVHVGCAIAEELHRAGYCIAIHYHASAMQAERLASRLPGSSLHQADLADVQTIERLAAEVGNVHGKVDVLVNSAAIFFPTPLGQARFEEWERLHAINLRAPFFLSQAIRPLMPPGGVIINITDVSALVPWPNYIPYSTTKAGLLAMTHGLARAWAPDIRVNAIAPGPVLLPEWYDAAQRERSISKTLLKREGRPENVAQAVRFLIENDYITGVVLPVDGGRLMA